jgi:hypothetical protein
MQTPPAPEAAPEAEQVLDGLWSLPVPIPGSPLPHVLAYAFRVPDGVVLVDPGWNAPEALAALGAGLAVAGARIETGPSCPAGGCGPCTPPATPRGTCASSRSGPGWC